MMSTMGSIAKKPEKAVSKKEPQFEHEKNITEKKTEPEIRKHKKEKTQTKVWRSEETKTRKQN